MRTIGAQRFGKRALSPWCASALWRHADVRAPCINDDELTRIQRGTQVAERWACYRSVLNRSARLV